MIIQQAQKKRLSDLLRSLAGAATFRALGNRSFALLWSGQTLSRIGDFLYQVALAWWVTELLGAPLVFVIGGRLTVVVATLALIGHPAN